MKLIDMVRLHASVDYDMQRFYITPNHPPSLKNPIIVKQEFPQDGWHQGDSKKARAQAIADLIEIVKRSRRQGGKPEIAQTAQLPTPDLWKKW